jgi:hypothetical protein
MRNGISQVLLYPLRFEPIYQYRLWGGRRLGDLLNAPLPSGPVGEAWILSDRDDHPSRVADGPLKGQTVGHLLAQFPQELLGKLAGRFRRFPLLLKFLDERTADASSPGASLFCALVDRVKKRTTLKPSARRFDLPPIFSPGIMRLSPVSVRPACLSR